MRSGNFPFRTGATFVAESRDRVHIYITRLQPRTISNSLSLVHFLADQHPYSIRMGFMQIAVFAVLVSALASALPQEARQAVSEDSLEKTLSDRRYLTRQLKCTLGEAPCDSVGRRLKSLAPLVLRGSCPQCTPQEMRQVQKVLAHVQKNYPKEWNKILQKYASG